MSETSDFRASLQQQLSDYLAAEEQRFDNNNCLRMDTHCHDFNSDKPSELWGRILGLPETWLPTEDLLGCLEKRGCDALTITNHNNAKSCWDLIDRGVDVLPAAEFTCRFPEYELFVHVLTFGFTREQEPVLNRLRDDVYEFAKYAAANNLPLILAHPLYNYSRRGDLEIGVFEKMAVIFSHFEVLNAQRDLWQCVLTLNWVQSLTAERVREYALKHELNPADYGVDPVAGKIITGGSDDHMGIFAGTSGSRLFVDNLEERRKTEKLSELALEAIRLGNVSPYGHAAENEKLNVALLDYFAQTATRMEDPGLLRMLLHQGEPIDKIACFVLGNVLLELRNHTYTQTFFGFIHDALQGKKPGRFQSWKVSKDYRFCVEHLQTIAASVDLPPAEFVAIVNNCTSDLFTRLNQLIVKRIQNSPISMDDIELSLTDIARKFEVPMQVTALLTGKDNAQSDMTSVSLVNLLDNLSFPVLVTAVLAGVSFASTRALYENRKFLNTFAEHLGRNQHQKRALYLTDTLFDKNGVSNSLSGKLAYIQQEDLPVDFLICHESAESQSHLHVVRPLASFDVQPYSEQCIRIPDLMEIVKLFYAGGYDRIVCSTEGPMVLVALYLKQMFNVPAQFFMHTDWVEFAHNTLQLSEHDTNRVRRLLRALYQQFDGVFVLNTDHEAWLTGYEMQLKPERVFLTAHHTTIKEHNHPKVTKSTLFSDATDATPILFVACRISREKGILELPEVLARVREEIPDTRLVVAGTGPDEALLKSLIPDAHFTGWISKEHLGALYQALDLFVFPSQFDTFGNVILEAFTYGMPVVTYDCKGPKDIVTNGANGFLVNSAEEFSEAIVSYLNSPEETRRQFGQRAKRRVEDYRAGPIMKQFMSDIGFGTSVQPLKSVA